ncbi:hypothetical protein llap_9454 [Limosa lapponica baueri]|uniref:CTP synthase (glutamine hydrolyzing) n=1 Tax=Limosa lapponica baueri TaxID=1758121 RepID=A0A2I0U2J0_LIMLA|nr:hypothetical protein llap_9454 [Limosa lapponica baueri]
MKLLTLVFTDEKRTQQLPKSLAKIPKPQYCSICKLKTDESIVKSHGLPLIFGHDTKHGILIVEGLVIDMPEHNPGDMGGTMRLGKRRTVFKTQNSVLRKLYGDEMFVEERHRHRYEVNPELTHCFEEKGLKFVGHDTEGNRMEIIELENPMKKKKKKEKNPPGGLLSAPRCSDTAYP